MTVNFDTFRLADYRPPLSLEETFILFSSWSGILSTNFDSLLDLATTTVTGTVDDRWNSGALRDEIFPSSFEIDYHKTAYRQGVKLWGQGGVSYYLVTTDATGYLNIYKENTLAYALPKGTPQIADVRIVFRQQQFANDSTDSNNPNEIWASISVYMNDALIGTYIDKKAVAYSTFQVAFLAYDTDSVTYTSIRVPELAETAEFGTLDQGEFPISGLMRSMEGRYLRFFIRWDGSFRAYRVKSIDSSLTLLEEELEITSIKDQYTDLKTHIRMVGAYTWAEYADTDLMATYGHRFREENNPMLLTQDECYTEAYRTVKRMQEDSFSEVVQTSVLPLLEPDDRITTPEGDWLMTGYNISIEEGGAIIEEATIRRYVWG